MKIKLNTRLETFDRTYKKIRRCLQSHHVRHCETFGDDDYNAMYFITTEKKGRCKK